MLNAGTQADSVTAATPTIPTIPTMATRVATESQTAGLVERDLTTRFQNLVVRLARNRTGVDEHQLRSSQILRSTGSKSEFGQAVDGVSKLISALRHILSETSRAGDFNPETEMQLSEYIHQCKSNIDALQNLCEAGRKDKRISPMEQAHRQGCVLILAERLKECMAAFEALQRARAARVEQEELAKRRRTPSMNAMTSRKDHWEKNPRRKSTLPPSPQGAQQLSFQSENYALQQDLSNLTDQAQHAEKTVREIASLNQAFSAALFHQAEQIETLYNQAVEASNHMDMGNVQLRKTVKTNGKSSKWVFIFLVVLSMLLLFADWWFA